MLDENLFDQRRDGTTIIIGGFFRRSFGLRFNAN